MNNKVLGIIGGVLFAAAVAVGCFANFAGSAVVEIALAAFGLASIVMATVKKAKEDGNFTWKTVVVIVLAVAGGALAAVGGVQSNIFESIAGAVVAIVSIIFGVFAVKANA